MAGLLSLILTAGLCVGLCHGLYFHIGETEQKCFMEEVPAETMIVGEENIMMVPYNYSLCR